MSSENFDFYYFILLEDEIVSPLFLRKQALEDAMDAFWQHYPMANFKRGKIKKGSLLRSLAKSGLTQKHLPVDLPPHIGSDDMMFLV